MSLLICREIYEKVQGGPITSWCSHSTCMATSNTKQGGCPVAPQLQQEQSQDVPVSFRASAVLKERFERAVGTRGARMSEVLRAFMDSYASVTEAMAAGIIPSTSVGAKRNYGLGGMCLEKHGPRTYGISEVDHWSQCVKSHNAGATGCPTCCDHYDDCTLSTKNKMSLPHISTSAVDATESTGIMPVVYGLQGCTGMHAPAVPAAPQSTESFHTRFQKLLSYQGQQPGPHGHGCYTGFCAREGHPIPAYARLEPSALEAPPPPQRYQGYQDLPPEERQQWMQVGSPAGATGLHRWTGGESLLHDMDDEQKAVVTQMDAGTFIPASVLKSVLAPGMQAVLDPSSYWHCTRRQLQELASAIRMGWRY